MRKQILSVTAAGCLALSLGCPEGGGGDKPGKTPQATFEAVQKASENKDHKAVFNYMDPEARDQVLLGMTVAAGFASMGKKGEEKKKIEDELDGILEKHGVAELDKKNIDPTDKESMNKAAKKMFTDVEDKGALFADLTTFFENSADKDTSKTKYTEGTLKDVEIEGEQATGMVERPDGESRKVTFVKREGRWYLGMGDRGA